MGMMNPGMLQSTLMAGSAMGSDAATTITPHHPITCQGPLELAEDGTLRCEHATAPPGNRRTQQCITHSIAILIIEEAVRKGL